MRLIEADARRSADTHLLRYPLPRWAAEADVALYLKDESTHITGSLKHRLARSLFLYGLCNGWISEGTTVIEASSGSTAVSEAYFAELIGVPFIAVMPESTSAAKIALIESQGGRCHFVAEAAQVYDEAQRLAEQTGGHYLDQFTNAERATDWRGNNNIAESIYEQLGQETHPVPEWIVVGAGTGGTSATIGRYIRYRRHPTQLCVVDPENSAFFPSYASGGADVVTGVSSRIEGIGRPRVEPGFLFDVVDAVQEVDDADAIAAAKAGRQQLSAGYTADLDMTPGVTEAGEHYDAMLAHYGPATGGRHARKHLGWYLDRHAATGAAVPLSERKAIMTANDHRLVQRRLRQLFAGTTAADLERAAAAPRLEAA